MIFQASCKPAASSDKENHFFIVGAFQLLRNAGNSERMGFSREGTDGREDHVCMLSGSPREPPTKSQSDCILRYEFDGSNRVLIISTPDSIIP